MDRPTPYQEKYSAGTEVQIADRSFLEHFMKTWQYHHKLTAEQLEYADKITTVDSVGFYHGGDPLYELAGIPGIWHEACLRAVKIT